MPLGRKLFALRQRTKTNVRIREESYKTVARRSGDAGEQEAKETKMKYSSMKDLPATITQVLPKDAQQAYLDAYNQAWDEYEQKGTGDLSRHSIAHRQAWELVERTFERDLNTDSWEHRSDKAVEYDSRSFLDKVKEAIGRLFS